MSQISKKGSYVFPGWLVMLILLLVIFGIILAWLLLSYKPQLTNFVRSGLLGWFGG